MIGYKNLSKMVKDGSVVLCKTDKSKRLALVSKGAYEEMGAVHTRKDEVIDEEKARQFQKQLNGYCRILGKALNIGGTWGHNDRVLDTITSDSCEVPPMYLLIKDHKGRGENGLIPTRPVVSGCKSMGVH